MRPGQLAAVLVRWHRHHGRHDLPWQRDRTPYRVWVSEVMLQQTQVATVVGYYERFLHRFPDVHALARADLDDVLHLWTGLGYYSRARHLHRTAQLVSKERGGEFPTDVETLAELPGIGRSTAAAIVALAHNRRATILDGNVKRVLARCFGVEGAVGEALFERRLLALAESCTPARPIATYTQAIMDFGATLCTRAKPGCDACPLSRQCVARTRDAVLAYPGRRRRAPRPTRRVFMLCVRRADGAVLLQRRPPRGIWGALWTPPQYPNERAARAAVRVLLGARARIAMLPERSHAFTHFDLAITPLVSNCGKLAPRITPPAANGAGASDTLWFDPTSPASVGLPAPVVGMLRELDAGRESRQTR